MVNGFHVSPTAPGYSSDIRESTYAEFESPNGSFWKSEVGLGILDDPWRGVLGFQRSKVHEGSANAGFEQAKAKAAA